MERKIVILPGTPNDENREFLPEAIKGSDMVVNENGNNSQVYPARLTEHTGNMVEEMLNTWYEYVPAAYDGTRQVPLIISLHGGLMTGWGQAVYSSWTLVADREGFIVVFPNACERRFWTVECDAEQLQAATSPNKEGIFLNPPPADPENNRDMKLVLRLIDHMKSKYNIDPGRIFIQGMSMGNLMTSQMARYHAQVFAGKAGSAGPTDPRLLFDERDEVINKGGPLAVWQTRLELDEVPPHYPGDSAEVIKRNREYWKRVNRCYTLPEIKIVGEDNFAFYKGEYADLVFRDVKNRDHGQTIDDAEIVWDYLFSGVSRDEQGRLVQTEPNIPRQGDEFALAFASGSDKVYFNNKLVKMSGPALKHYKLKYHGLNGSAIIRGEYLLVPASFVAHAFGGKNCNYSNDGQSVEMILKDGRTLQFTRGSIGCVVENRVYSMLCEAVYKDGELYLPIQWICQRLLNYHVSSCGDVLYITDHHAELSLHMARLIRDEILNCS